MRRMSASDIVITPEDRPGVHRALPRRAAEAGEAAKPRSSAKASEKKRAAKRKPARPRLALTPLQKAAAGALGATVLVVGLAALWHSGAPQRLYRDTVEALLDVTARAGLRIEEITVAGRARTPVEPIIQALGVGHGDPILGLDIGLAKDRLEAIPTVRAVAVERRLPGRIHLVIAEREPVAVWQTGGTFVLVDRTGREIPGDAGAYRNLPLVVGDGAPQRADDLLTMISAEPAIAARVKAAVRVGSRRWNIKLDDVEAGVEVRLPENEPEAALKRLAEIEREHALTGKRVAMIDLRHPDRLVLRAEREAPGKDNGD